MPNPIVHWEIAAKDAKKAQAFYSQLFGWHVDASNPMNYGLVDTHSKKGINGGITATQAGMPPVTIYVEVDDLSAYLKKAERLGGKTLVPPTVVPNMVTFAMFSDPQGTVMGLVKSEQPASAPKPSRAAARTPRAAGRKPAARTTRR